MPLLSLPMGDPRRPASVNTGLYRIRQAGLGQCFAAANTSFAKVSVAARCPLGHAGRPRGTCSIGRSRHATEHGQDSHHPRRRVAGAARRVGAARGRRRTPAAKRWLKCATPRRSAGVDFINEGELTKGGHWTEYLPTRLGGYEPRRPSRRLGELLMSSTDWVEFRDFYLAVLQNGTLFEQSGGTQHVPEGAEDTTAKIGRGLGGRRADPLSGVRPRSNARSTVMKAALGDTPVSDAFLTTTAPLSVEPGRVKGIYATDEEHIYAIAEAMRVEYEAIAAAGFQVQVDDAWLGALWDRIGIPMGLDGYRKYCQMRCEALNHALRNIPEEQIRYHLCWGSWHGPHSADLPLPDIVDIMLSDQGPDATRSRRPTCATSTRWRCGRTPSCPTARSRPRCGHALDAVDRAPAARRRPHPALRQAGRPRERHRLHRLRPRSAAPPIAGVGQVELAHRRRPTRIRFALAVDRGAAPRARV